MRFLTDMDCWKHCDASFMCCNIVLISHINIYTFSFLIHNYSVVFLKGTFSINKLIYYSIITHVCDFDMFCQ